MSYKKVHAVVRTDTLKAVKKRLQGMHLPNLVITEVKEYGDHHELFAFRTEYRYARIEVFAEEDGADDIASAIVETAHTGLAGDGLVAVLPVDVIYRIRDKAPAHPDDLASGERNGHD